MRVDTQTGGRLIIAGSRDITDFHELLTAIAAFGIEPDEVVEVISGCASGVDTLAMEWAQEFGIPVRRFPADWRNYGVSAGPRRNTAMADYVKTKGGLLLVLWDGKSRGTKDMIDKARHAFIPTLIWYVEPA